LLPDPSTPLRTKLCNDISVPAGGRECPAKFELTQASDGPPAHVTSPKPSQTETTGLDKVRPSSTRPHTDNAMFMTLGTGVGRKVKIILLMQCPVVLVYEGYDWSLMFILWLSCLYLVRCLFVFYSCLALSFCFLFLSCLILIFLVLFFLVLSCGLSCLVHWSCIVLWLSCFFLWLPCVVLHFFFFVLWLSCHVVCVCVSCLVVQDKTTKRQGNQKRRQDNLKRHDKAITRQDTTTTITTHTKTQD
jgi:hypothetical protein